mgnify:CR=1 FL=1
MTSNELRELVKSHFNLVEADAEVNVTEIEETFSEETTEEVVEESFGEIADENKAFTLRFPGDELEVGDKVTVVTTEGQEMAAPDGEHRLADGVVIVTKDSVVESIEKSVAETTEETLEEEAAEIVEEEMAEVNEEVVEEIIEEVKEAVSEDMMEEPAVDAKAIIEAIAEEVTAEMGKLKEKMEALEEKMAKFEMEPAADKTIVSTGKKVGFNANKAKNSKDMDLMLRMIKNKK